MEAKTWKLELTTEDYYTLMIALSESIEKDIKAGYPALETRTRKLRDEIKATANKQGVD